jgi:crotonobetainyl-CoA:carnitine CoA-transferase CaiB-like acyl-CoA transferase
MLLDLKQPGALDVVWRLIDDADVVLHNFRPGVMERLGIGYDEASRRRPGIIYVSITAYGEGPWGTRPGYEGFGQASTGIAARQGGDGRPNLQPFPVNDYGTGLSAAFAATLALYHRSRTGQGQQGAAALAYTGTILQSPYMQLYEGKEWGEPAGPGARGFGPLQALYRAADGWFYLGASESQLAALASVDGLAGIGGLAGDTLMAALDARFATASVATWCGRIQAKGLGAHRLVGMRELMSDPWVIAHGLSVTREHDTGEVITTVGPPARLSRTPVNVGRAAASPGADGLDVLASIGMAHEAERLAAAGAFRREPLPVA